MLLYIIWIIIFDCFYLLGTHWSHWTKAVSYAWSTALWLPSSNSISIDVIYDPEGNGSPWIDSMRHYMEAIWGGSFIHDYQPWQALNLSKTLGHRLFYDIVDFDEDNTEAWIDPQYQADRWFVSRLDSFRLRRHIISPSVINEMSPFKQNDTINKIFILNRQNNRYILNLDDILIYFKNYYYFVDLSVSYFENSTLEEQAEQMYSTDILISPHGAGLANIMFMRPCSIVIELFPWVKII